MASKLEESPEFQAALNEACEAQYRGWFYGGAGVKAETKSQIDGVMKEIQHKKREAEAMRESLALRASATGFHMSNIPNFPDEITPESMEAYREEIQAHSDRIRAETERQRNPHFQEITRNLRKRHDTSGLVCPVCGEGDHGNRMDKRPYCFMNAKHGELGPVPLMSPEKAKEWKPPKKKPKPKSYIFKEPDGVVRK